MFNLNKEEKYKKIGSSTSIWCTKDFGPWTMNFGFIGAMKKIEHRGQCINDSYQRGYDILPNNTTQYKYFEVKEVEVYEIMIQ